MQPTFRTDLICTREEQDGVVYYQLEDPQAESSFRLYEIEFHIAQQLDGKHTLHEVAQIIKQQHDFEISDADLLKFIGQLKSMNFVTWPDDTNPAPPFLQPPHDLEPMGDVATLEVVLQDVGAQPQPPRSGAGGGDRAGARQMLMSGLTHLRQGELAHARDFIIAAQQKDPKRAHLDELVELIDSLGENATAKERAALWRQCGLWFPEIVGVLPPAHQPKRLTGVQTAGSATSQRPSSALSGTVAAVQGSSVAKRWLLGGGIFGVIAVCSAALFLMWNSAPSVRGRRLEAERLPVFSPQPATNKSTLQDVWFSFERGGRIGDIVPQGKRVGEHELLVALSMPAPERQVLNAIHATVLQAENQLAEQQAALTKLLEQRHALEAQQASAVVRMKKLRPKGGAVNAQTRAEMGRVRQSVAHTSSILTHLAQELMGPKTKVARLSARLVGLRRRQAELETRFAVQKHLAPFAGEITEVRAKVGDAVRPGAPLVHLQNPASHKLRFALAQPGTLQVGGEVSVVPAAGSPLTAKVRSLSSGRGGTQIVDVELYDPTGGLLHVPASAFRLIERYADPAFRVSARALVRDAKVPTARVILMIQGRATYRSVQVLSEVDGEAIIYDPEGKLANRHVILTAVEDGSPLSLLKEGTEVALVSL